MKSKAFLYIIIAVSIWSISLRAADPFEKLAAKYQRCKTEAEKRAFCIEAFDTGVVGTGTDMADFRRIFQKDFEELGTALNGKDRSAIVYFIPPLHSPDPMVSGVQRGWYLALT